MPRASETKSRDWLDVRRLPLELREIKRDSNRLKCCGTRFIGTHVCNKTLGVNGYLQCRACKDQYSFLALLAATIDEDEIVLDQAVSMLNWLVWRTKALAGAQRVWRLYDCPNVVKHLPEWLDERFDLRRFDFAPLYLPLRERWYLVVDSTSDRVEGIGGQGSAVAAALPDLFGRLEKEFGSSQLETRLPASAEEWRELQLARLCYEDITPSATDVNWNHETAEWIMDGRILEGGTVVRQPRDGETARFTVVIGGRD